MTEQLAWIGLGNMGRGMVRNLLAKAPLSAPLLLYNRTPSRTTQFASTLDQTAISIAASLHSAVSPASIIFTCLGNDEAVESTIHSLIESPDLDLTGKTFVDCSTVHPNTSRIIAARLERHGASFVAAPVFGATPVAEAGQLVCVLAGKPEVVERVKPYFAGVTGRANIDLSTTSSDPGRAGVLKLLGNSMIFQMVTAVSEGMVVAEKSGLGTDAVQEFLELVFPGPAVGYAGRMSGGDYFKREEPLFGVEWAKKDMRHAMDVAENVDAEVNGVELVYRFLGELQDERGEKADVAGIYGIARMNAGLEFENGTKKE